MSQILLMGLALALLTALLGSATTVLLRISMLDIGPLQSVLVNAFLGIPIMIVAGLLTGELAALGETSWMSVGYAAIAGLVMFAAGRFLWYQGIRIIGASRTNSVVASQAFLTPLLSILLLGERVSVILAPAVALIFLGGYVITRGHGSESDHSTKESRSFIFGFLICVACTLVFSIGTLIIRVAILSLGSPIPTYLIATSTAFIFLLPVVVVRKESFSGFRGKSGRILLAAGVAQALGSISYWIALSLAPVAIVNPLSQSFPLFTLLLSYIFIRRLEQINLAVVIGACLMVAGVLLVALA